MNNKIHLAIVRNPFDVAKDREFRQFNYLPGVLVRNYLQSCLVPPDWQVFYSPRGKEGRVLRPEEIDTIIPEIGDALVTMPVAAGGDWEENRKTILTIVAQIGLAMATMGAGNLASTGAWSMSASTMSSWSVWGTLAAVATAYAGGWIINQITPGAPVTDASESTIYGWGQITNATGAGNAIPLTFGEVRTGGQLLNYYVDYDGDKQYLNLLYSGGEGPCDYEANGETDPGEPDYVSGISGILINGNPVENYQEIKIYKRAGLNGQSVVGNFADTFVEQALAFELQQSKDWSDAATAITSGNSGQAFKVVLEMPAGCYRSNNNGLAKAEVKVEIRYRPYGDETVTEASWLNAGQIIVSDNTSKPIYKTLKIDPENSPGQYEVQCLCTSKSGDDANYSTSIYWRTLTTITYDDFIYPNKIILGITVLATDQISGGMPTVTWVQKRSKGWVWNPDTSTYEAKPLNVPAWAAYDLLCRIKRYQNINDFQWKFAVEGIDKERIDYPAFAEAAEYQSKPIGGEQFCSCNYYLDQTMTLWEALKAIEEVGRFKILPRGTKYSCVTDKPVPVPAQVFTVGNTILDSFGETFVDTAKRANAIEIRFRNKDKDYEWDTAVETTDDYDDSRTVPNPVQVTLTACTGWDQAHREGAYRLRQNQLITRTASHSADIDAIACQVGDVYYLQRDVPNWGTGGRIVEATETTVTLDAPVTFEPGKNYALLLRFANDTLIHNKPVINPVTTEGAVETQTIFVSEPFVNDRHVPTYIDSVQFSVPGNQVGLYQLGKEVELEYGAGLTLVDSVLAANYDASDDYTIIQVLNVPEDIYLVRFGYTMPRENDVYSFGETNIVAKPFRVTSITRDGDLRRKITGTEYVEAVYDESAGVSAPDYTGATESILASANSHIDAAGNPWLDLSWTTPRYYFGARIDLNGKGIAKVDNAQNSVAIQLETCGDYTIKVTAFDLFGANIASTSLNYSINLNAIPPENVTNLLVVEDTFILRDGTVITDVAVSFKRPDQFYKAFNVYYSLDMSTWILAGQTTGDSYQIKLVKNAAKIAVKVGTVSPYNIESIGAAVTIDLVGKSNPPSDVTGFTVVQDEYNRARIILSWDTVDSESNPDLKGYEIRVGENWDAGTKLGGVVYGIQTEYIVAASGNYIFFIRALDNSGNYSAKAAVKSITIEVKPDAPTNGTGTQDGRDSTYVVLNWTAVADKDLSAYEIKQGGNWDAAEWVDSTKETTYRLKLKSSGTYNFMVRAKNTAGFLSNILNIPITASIEAPDVTGFSVSQKDSDPSQIRFMWNKPSPLDIAYYEIREGTTWDDGEVVASYIVGLFYDSIINNESPKTFWIKAINVGGIYSQYPAKYVAIFELNPSTPTGLTVSQDPNDRSVLTISWTGIVDLDLYEYELRQGTTWEAGHTIIKTKELQTTWTPAASGDYKFILKAKNNAGYYSDEVETHYYVTLEPVEVSGFKAFQNGAAVILTWDKHAEPDVVGYEIREGSQFDNGSLIATGIPGTSWETPVDTETTHQYYIKAINRAGKYSQSAAAAIVAISNLPPKNVIYSYDELGLQSGTHQNTAFGPSSYNFATFGGKFSDYPETRFADVGGLTVLKLEGDNLITTIGLVDGSVFTSIGSCGEASGSYPPQSNYIDITTFSEQYIVIAQSIEIVSMSKGNFYCQIQYRNADYMSLGHEDWWYGTSQMAKTRKVVCLDKTTFPADTQYIYFTWTWWNTAADFSGQAIVYGDMVVRKSLEYKTVFEEGIVHYPNSGSYFCQRKDMGSVITANIGSRFGSSVLLSSGVSAKLQYRTSRDGTTWTEWIDYVSIQATFRYIDFRVLLSTFDVTKTPEVNIFKESVDVPDVDKYGSATVAAGGTDIPFGYTYWQTPVVTPAAIGQGLRAELVSVAQDKFRVRVLNTAGADVGGRINWLARGF